jgi:hypothetical protein
MVTRWALVGTLALAALGCSKSENGRYVPMPSGGGVLDTRTGRMCVPKASGFDRAAAKAAGYTDAEIDAFLAKAHPYVLCFEFEQRATPDTSGKPIP